MEKNLLSYFEEKEIIKLYSLFVSLGIDEPKLMARLKYSDLERLGVENFLERKKVFEIICEINNAIQTDDESTSHAARNDMICEPRAVSNIRTPEYFTKNLPENTGISGFVRNSHLSTNEANSDAYIDDIRYRFGEGDQYTANNCQRESNVFAPRISGKDIEGHGGTIADLEAVLNHGLMSNLPDSSSLQGKGTAGEDAGYLAPNQATTTQRVLSPGSSSSFHTGFFQKGNDMYISGDTPDFFEAGSELYLGKNGLGNSASFREKNKNYSKQETYTQKPNETNLGQDELEKQSVGIKNSGSQVNNNKQIGAKVRINLDQSFADDSSITKDSSIIFDNYGASNDIKISVCVRKRPSTTTSDVISIYKNEIVIKEAKIKLDLEPYVDQHKFVFDHIFNETKTNEDVYRIGIKDITQSIIEGNSGSIIAYGQTGTGKTYTMQGDVNGIIFVAMKDIMGFRSKGTVLFCEIYMGKVYDLLNNGAKISLMEAKGETHLINSKEVKFSSYDEFHSIVKVGFERRKTGMTGVNVKSSRSHAVIIVQFPSKNTLTFVDLAGSERGIDRVGSLTNIKNEGAEMNKRLLALKECIRGIEKDFKHLPFRQSKLTQILKSSFVGKSKICLIATVSPNPENVEHTLNTLRYAARIRESLKFSRKCNDSKSDSSPSMLTLGSSILSLKEFEEQASQKQLNTTKLEEEKLLERILTKSREILMRIQFKLAKIKCKEELTRAYNDLNLLERTLDQRRK